MFNLAQLKIYHMKKTLLFASAVAIFLSVGCGKKGGAESKDNTKDTTAKEEVKKEVPMTGTVSLSKTEVEPGEEITVEFKAEGTIGENAWIGLIPAGVEHGNESKNDENDLTYQYLGDKTSGIMSFVAPADTGKYDFRLNSTDNNGVEVASVTFSVKGVANTKADITIEKKSFAQGEQINISFKANPAWEAKAWIGLVPAATKHGSATENDKVDVAYDYMDKRSKGTMKFTAPSEAGKYSLRMFDAYSGKEVKSVDFTVQ